MIVLAAALLGGGLLLAACTSSKLPAVAEEALLAYWDSLPSPPGYEHEIIRAWRGTSQTQDGDALPAEMEVWCVETVVSAPSDPVVDGDKLIWIVTREQEEADWQAILLAAMSSLWPYEACETAP